MIIYLLGIVAVITTTLAVVIVRSGNRPRHQQPPVKIDWQTVRFEHDNSMRVVHKSSSPLTREQWDDLAND